MNIVLKRIFIAPLLALMLTGCWDSNKDESGHESEYFIGTKGSIIFDSYPPFSSRPIKVFYNIPAGGNRSTMPILFAMHGVDRNAEDYLNAWEVASNNKKFIVIAPEFSTANFPGSSNYNLGGMFNGPNLKPEAEWTFSLIEALFDFAVADLGSNQEVYDIWGHSAGGQFVHRYVLFKPNSRINRAVAANSGWYTITDFDVAFPYGLGSSPATSVTLGDSFKQRLVVQLGTADTNTNDPNLEHNANVDAQGLTRFARGTFFWNVANGKKTGHPVFNWTKREVAGVAHEYKKMATDAALLLYN